MRIDPRVFIGSPFKKCPNCGEEQLGFLGPAWRRCRKCWHEERLRLPELRKRIIYIDQFAISNMMKTLNAKVKGHKRAAEDTLWLRLFEALELASKAQLIICPDSSEHQDESLVSPFYADLKRLYELLSHGHTFYRSNRIASIQIVQAAEAWIKGERPVFDFNGERVTGSGRRLHEWTDKLIISVNLNYDQEFTDKLRETRDRIHVATAEVFERQKTQKKSFDECFHEEQGALGRAMREIYRRWDERRRRFWAGEDLELEELLAPSAVSDLNTIHDSFVQGGVPEDKAWAKVSEFLDSDALAQVPFSLIGSSMHAVICAQAGAGRKNRPNRGTANDIRVISALMPYCDAMFIDNGARSILGSIPNHRRLPYPTRMFSYNTGEEFIRFTQEIIDSAPREHMELVDDIYGDGWRAPYVTLYQ